MSTEPAPQTVAPEMLAERKRAEQAARMELISKGTAFATQIADVLEREGGDQRALAKACEAIGQFDEWARRSVEAL